MRFRVVPSETLYGVLINSRYLDLIEVGRIEWLARVGMIKLARSQNWIPLATSQGIVYKRPFRLFDRIELVTRICSWNERTLHLEHYLMKSDKVHAAAVSKASFVGSNGVVPPREVLHQLGVDSLSPAASTVIEKWAIAESELYRLRSV